MKSASSIIRGPRPPRRRVLSGAGVLVGLPFLHSLERSAQAAVAPKRLLACFLPCGIHMPAWRIAAEGPLAELSPTLAPLEKVKSKLLVLSGLQQRQLSGFGAHNFGPAGFLTCRKASSAQLNVGGPSMDQVVAQTLGKGSRISSLQLALNDGVDGAGVNAIYSKSISWASATQPLAATSNVSVAFDRLFAGVDPSASRTEQLRRQARRSSVLDHVRQQAQSLRPRLARSDGMKLDEYFNSIRELEQQAQPAPAVAGTACGMPAKPAGNLPLPDKTRAMCDLIALALQCDATRVISFMLGNGGFGALTPSFMSINEHHHVISHHKMNPTNQQKLQRIDLWELQQVAYLLEKMDRVVEGDGRTLLDNSAVYISNEISDGDRHNFDDLPVVIAGRAGGALRPGRHLRLANEAVANVFITLMNALDVPTTRFAEGTRPAVGLT